MTHPYQDTIETIWTHRNNTSVLVHPDHQKAVEMVLRDLDAGHLRVSEKTPNGWVTNTWIKKAILLFFQMTSGRVLPFGGTPYFDKAPLKCANWTESDFVAADFRLVPGAVVRYTAYVAPKVVVMPSFINVGAHVGTGTMIDTWATVGSCAQIGAHCHISGGAGIGGVLEPLQSSPVIIEDHCFIGARSEIAEGVIIGEGAVISMGVFLGASTKIIDRETGNIHTGYVPPYAVVVPGTLPPASGNGPALACAVIIKQVDAKTRSKTAINDLLRGV